MLRGGGGRWDRSGQRLRPSPWRDASPEQKRQGQRKETSHTEKVFPVYERKTEGCCVHPKSTGLAEEQGHIMLQLQHKVLNDLLQSDSGKAKNKTQFWHFGDKTKKENLNPGVYKRQTC
ncbi:hypothetical protein AV530_019532 [Patagioenas fasciata monilis]|uniref:Uncharacterized protein n=1 Tax=Patagioenas fasciata monilis TaxID=372326 RepID=A0A1V4JE90_PATFA|nr:hypothetical protein AV530_019532 [Patagioenas fasciata monilis]